MATSNSRKAEINVTPMIDILLVLLIILMVIVPSMPRGETAQAPNQQKSGPANPDNVVLEVLKGSGGEPAFKINQHLVAKQDLPARLASIYANRAQRILFLKGDDQLSFTEIAEAIDIGHAAGADRIGLMTPKVLAGQ
jgi:biopolymer transport protein ExbD